MDRAKAEALADQLVGRELDGWTIDRLVDNGKSAAVFAGHRDGQLAAVKVFDTELIERYGDHTQLARIERELELRGEKHDNLVSIYGGGHDAHHNLYFVVMEFLDGPNLKSALPNIAVEQVPSLVAQLASAAKFLEDKGLVHRDIKPENIVLLDGGRRLVLLDLGVIRPISGSDLTDPDGIHAFIGTLQYSSPEFLLREEVQDVDGYRALTFYQIGAVLHDMLVKRPIFEQFANPYAKLVNAVQFERPIIVNPDAPQQLIQLAERCLLKNPATRVRVVRWNDFASTEHTPRVSARDRVAERMVTLRAQSEEARAVSATPSVDARRVRQSVLAQLKSAATTARTSTTGLPPLRNATVADGLAEFQFEPGDHCFPHGLSIRASVEVLDAAEVVISCRGLAYFPGRPGGAPPMHEVAGAWFEGVLDSVQLQRHFESLFFKAIEWCLAVSPGVDADHASYFQSTRCTGE